MRRFGARVTVIEKEVQLASREDADVGGALLELFQSEGIDVLLKAKLHSVQGHLGQHITVHVEDENGVRTLEGSDLLVAVGRTPNTNGIGLEQVGIRLTPQGFVE